VAETLVNKVANVELDLEMSMSEEETASLQQLKASNIWRTLRVASVARLSKFDKLSGDKNLNVLLDGTAPEQGPPVEDNQDGEGATGEVEGDTTTGNDDKREAGDTTTDTNIPDTVHPIPVVDVAE
jgi:hypothetical protein